MRFESLTHDGSCEAFSRSFFVHMDVLSGPKLRDGWFSLAFTGAVFLVQALSQIKIFDEL